MKITVLSRLVPIALSALLMSTTTGAVSAQEETQPAATSKLTGVALPAKAVRILENSVPADLTSILTAIMQAAGPKVQQGRTEVLAWTGNGYKKAQAPQLMSQVAKSLQEAGWQYDITQQASGEFTMVTALRTVPTRKALIGFWMPGDDALLLAWTEMLPATPASTTI
jgi:hypothetical protein